MSEADTATTPAPAPVVTCTAYSAGYADLTIDGVGMEAQPTAPATPAISVLAAGDGSTYPETVTVTIAGVAHIIDVSGDRDDWQLPEVADGHEHRMLWAIEDAIELWLSRNEPESTRIERVWAGAVSL